MGNLDFFATDEKTEQAISPLKDPFSKDCIEAVNIYIRKNPLFGGPPIRANVEFKNGSTQGRQDFQGTELSAVAKEIQAFLDTLKENNES